MSIKVCVGLGNPGQTYQENRHNIGFLAVEAIAKNAGASGWKKQFQGEISSGIIASRKIIFLKPHTFMNESGRCVGAMMRYFSLEPTNILVLHDELDLEPGKIKIKTGGGHAGHNGLRSITSHIGQEFHRVRIGIGRPATKNQVSSYVLKDFSNAEQEWVTPLIETIADHSDTLIKGEFLRFQNLILNHSSSL